MSTTVASEDSLTQARQAPVLPKGPSRSGTDASWVFAAW